MCYRVQVNTGVGKIAERFKAHVENPENLFFNEEINGFAYQALPIITNQNPEIIASDFFWGLIPSWCNDDSIKKNTLNAKVETLEDKPAFRDVIQNRCLIIATGYYEWRWNDAKGKSKQKFEIHSAEEEIFAFAGIYSTWKNSSDNNILKTFSIVTTQANPQMEYIHNMKKRMPLMLKKEDEKNWLDSSIAIENFAFPNYNAEIIAFPV